ncbi:MAG: hypothetical protein U0R19_34740 [Bryobacteraceae bacterium]
MGNIYYSGKNPTRRHLLRAAAGLAALSGLPAGFEEAAFAQCAVVGAPSLTEGPYFVDEILNRSDIRSDPDTGVLQPGFPLVLTLNFSRVDDCVVTPLAGAFVDIWHCNAAGVYSDVAAQSSTGQRYLRGYQITDRGGRVEFTTIYPGWYQGRAVHIHFKVRFFSKMQETYEFTSQLFFEDAFSDEIYRLAPYSSKGSPDTRNAADGIYSGASALGSITRNSGDYLLLKAKNEGHYASSEFNLILDVAAGSTPDQPGGAGGPGGGPGGPPPGGGPPPR